MTDSDEVLPASSGIPTMGATAFHCPRCGAFAHQNWVALHLKGMPRDRFDDGPPDYAEWSAATCGRCDGCSIWRADRMVFPQGGPAPLPHDQMPQDAKALYEEAREVVGISRRAGTALARASLERLLRTLDPEAGNVNLATRIDRMAPRLPEPLKQMLTVIRVAGNGSLHVDDEPDDVLVLVLDPGAVEVVELVFESINDLVEELIAKPDKVAKLYAKVPSGIRARVEQAGG